MDVIKARLGLGKPVTPQEAANAAADKLGGQVGGAANMIRNRHSRIDDALNESLGMPKPKGQK
jgi:hypothetical protein